MQEHLPVVLAVHLHAEPLGVELLRPLDVGDMQYDVVDPARLDHLSSSLRRARRRQVSPERASVADSMSQHVPGLKPDPPSLKWPGQFSYNAQSILWPFQNWRTIPQ